MIDLTRLDRAKLTDEGRDTLDTIAWPLARGEATVAEIAERKGVTTREISRRRDELADELLRQLEDPTRPRVGEGRTQGQAAKLIGGELPRVMLPVEFATTKPLQLVQ